MVVGMNTGPFLGMPLFKALERIVSLGYEAIEIDLEEPHISDGTLSETAMKGLKDFSAENKIQYSVHVPCGREFDIADQNDSSRIEITERIKHDIVIADKIGAKELIIHPGNVGDNKETAISLTTQTINHILPLAKKLRIDILIENLYGTALENVKDGIRILSEVGDPNCGLCLDTSHAFVAGVDSVEFLVQLGGYIQEVHLSNVVSKSGELKEHQLPDKGDIDLGRILRSLQFIGFEGRIIFEFLPGNSDEELLAARRFGSHGSDKCGSP